jgi:hypothetical protein
MDPVRRGTARGSGRSAKAGAGRAGDAVEFNPEDANRRGARPPAATSTPNRARKDLRVQCGFTVTSNRQGRDWKEKKRNGFRDVNHISPSCQKTRGVISHSRAIDGAANHNCNDSQHDRRRSASILGLVPRDLALGDPEFGRRLTRRSSGCTANRLQLLPPCIRRGQILFDGC